jgi:hypothetical protein
MPGSRVTATVAPRPRLRGVGPVPLRVLTGRMVVWRLGGRRIFGTAGFLLELRCPACTAGVGLGVLGRPLGCGVSTRWHEGGIERGTYVGRLRVACRLFLF